ncbi:GntR family transcriptional regulator [Ruania halotolerans]|uniref:GntR family transcriptional regulator n=1 Tax=Ruania halotolerans TaxID=2897773 RepID=UPI001E32B46F|nr:GntR family transcriptional regulator [Ruania halotolerans]UFU06605.1 GntR family transcriptional regulator [Ruania halotolerans]
MLESRLGPSSLLRVPAGAVVADVLRDAIVEGRLRPGDRLKQEDLMQYFGVSVGPVRESLRTLESEGIVVSAARRGYLVSDVTLEEVEFLLPIRLVLEQAAFTQLQQTLDEDVLRALRQRIEEIRDGASNNSIRQVNEADQAFHEAVVLSCSRSPQAVRLWRLIMPRVRMLFNMLTPMHRTLSAVAQEHEILVQAVESGSQILLQTELDKHIRTQPQTLLQAKIASPGH